MVYAYLYKMCSYGALYDYDSMYDVCLYEMMTLNYQLLNILRRLYGQVSKNRPFSSNFFCRRKCNIASSIASLLSILKLYNNWIISFKTYLANESKRNKSKIDF